MTDLEQLIKQSWAKGSPTDWFEAVYAGAANGEGRIPWAHLQPNPEVMAWLQDNPVSPQGQRALVIGCGLGDDAEGLAEYGFSVTAFDIAPTAIEWCKRRFPETPVDYVIADLLNPPDEWQHAFDFVLEHRTIQSLPYDLADQAIESIVRFVAPGGMVLVYCHAREPHESRRGIPWNLSREELQIFEQLGLTEVQFDDFSKNGLRRFLVAYRLDNNTNQ